MKELKIIWSTTLIDMVLIICITVLVIRFNNLFLLLLFLICGMSGKNYVVIA